MSEPSDYLNILPESTSLLVLPSANSIDLLFLHTICHLNNTTIVGRNWHWDGHVVKELKIKQLRGRGITEHTSTLIGLGVGLGVVVSTDPTIIQLMTSMKTAKTKHIFFDILSKNSLVVQKVNVELYTEGRLCITFWSPPKTYKRSF